MEILSRDGEPLTMNSSDLFIKQHEALFHLARWTSDLLMETYYRCSPLLPHQPFGVVEWRVSAVKFLLRHERRHFGLISSPSNNKNFYNSCNGF